MSTYLHGPISKKIYMQSMLSMMNRIERDLTPLPQLPLLRELEIALQVNEAAEQNAKIMDCGDLWYKAWKRSLDLAEQIAMVKELQPTV